MSTILSKVKGFTPVIDVIVQDIGLMGATVYGVMWRYFQMEDHVCRASLQTIADRIGTDKSTVQRHAKMLCAAGYIVDKTPDRKNRPHIYADAGKAIIEGLLEARSVAQNNTTLQSATPRCTEQHHVAENHEKIVSKTASKIVSKKVHGEDAAIVPPNSTPAVENDSFEEMMGPCQYPALQENPAQSDGNGDKPWQNWSNGKLHPRATASVDVQDHVAWILESITTRRPTEKQWKLWSSECAAMYESARGDFDIVRAGIQRAWEREERYKPRNIAGFAKEVATIYSEKHDKATKHQRAQQQMKDDPQREAFRQLREANE